MKYIHILLLVLLYLQGNAQFRELHFNHLKGLPDGTESAMLQDDEGYMWIGTQSGLIRFDGYSSKVYNLSGPVSLPSAIAAICKDGLGRLWVGTVKDGLFKYNRATDTFIQYAYRTGENSLISSNNILSISSDTLNNLWLITYDERMNKKFIDVLSTSTGKSKHLHNKDQKNDIGFDADVSINGLLVQKNGLAWIGTDNGIYRYEYDSNKLTHLLATDKKENQKVLWGLYEDPKERDFIWMFSENSVKYFSDDPDKIVVPVRYNAKKNTIEFYGHDPMDKNSIHGEKFTPFQKDRQNNLWIGSPDGLSEFDNASSHFINYTFSVADKKTTFDFFDGASLLPDKDGNIWYKTPVDLLFFNAGTKQFTRYIAKKNNPDGLPFSVFPGIMNDLLMSAEGSFWVGMAGFGVHWLNLNRSKFTSYQVTNDIDNKYKLGHIECFAEAGDSTFWLASDKGLYHWYPRTDSFVPVKIVNDFKHQFKYDLPFRGIATDHEGMLWICLMGNGLVRYDPVRNTLAHFSYNKNDSNSVCGKIVRYVFKDHLGTMWIGTNESGICSYNAKTNNFTRYSSLNDKQVNCIYEDSSGTIWVGTSDGELSYLLQGHNTFTRLAIQYGNLGEVISIYADSRNIWVATHLGGLFLVDKKSRAISRFTEKDGLASNTIIGICQDNFKRNWLLSPDRLTIMDSKTNGFRILTPKNGLPDFSTGGFTKFYKTKEGKFLVGCDDGFIVFDPQQFFPDTVPPVIHIETISFENIEAERPKDSLLTVSEKNTIRLKYYENKLAFHYTGLQYQYSELNQYAYKLHGYDKDWIQAGTQRTVIYNNLAPGTYTFHVKAANSDGIWSANDDEITVVISPPWWRTWWAYLLYAVLTVGGLWAFIYLRGRRLIKENRILEQKIKLRTTEVMEQKEELTVQRDNLEKTLVELKSTQSQLIHSEKMASLGELTAGIAHEIQNPLNFVNNFSDVNKELLAEMKDEIDKGNIDGAKTIANDVISNEEKINYHGKRADAIVKGMSQHSRSSTGVIEPTDVNALADEYLRLAFHGMRAKEKSFNATLKTDYDPGIGKTNIIPPDIGRVLLNLYNNAFYTVAEKRQAEGVGYEPTVSVVTKLIKAPSGLGVNQVSISVSDNGNGIPQKVVDKIFQPFFTTKPAGQGTGLGLSLSYDIIKAHGGEIKVKTKEGEGTDFIIELPVRQ